MSKNSKLPSFYRHDTLLKDAHALSKLDLSSSVFKKRLEKSQQEFQKYTQCAPGPRALVQSLPVSEYESLISKTISDSQVTVIQGATGSGKSTQIPKILLNLGLSEYGLIGMTQPRRLAAQVLSQRIREEVFDTAGSLVGWQVRHHKNTGAFNRIKVMTDGILLQEAIKDRTLAEYQAIIIDEVHERSVNTDLLLGLLNKLLRVRPDIKIILLSATIDAQSFSDFFGKAPILDIPGKTYPIADIFLPQEEEVSDYWQKVTWAIEKAKKLSGDILFFLPTEFHIFQHKNKLEKLCPQFEILPLFSRLPYQQQQKLFESSTKRRLILSTNIAETSITLPSIRIVIDEGSQKIDRFDPGLKMLSYPIVSASQAQIKQRRGRCGRTGPGHCFYLYTEQDYENRDRNLIPAILRSSTDQLVLQLLSMGNKTLESFPFFQQPHQKSIRESLSVLRILNLCDKNNNLTDLGKKIRYKPLEPRLALILEKAKEHHCFIEVSIIVAFFMGDDPRLQPRDYRQLALKKHSVYKDLRSDFISILNLYRHVQGLKNKALRNYAKENFLSVQGLIFWRKNIDQLLRGSRQKLETLTVERIEDSFCQIHRALSYGLVDKVFYKDKESYVGPRGVKPIIDKRSGIKISSMHQWVVAFALERRSEVFINFVGPVETHFMSQLVKEQIKVVKKEPFLCEKTGNVYQSEDHLIWGLPLVSGKRKLLSVSNLPLARQTFIKQIFAQELWLEKLDSWAMPYQKALFLTNAARDTQILKSHDEIALMALESWPEDLCSFEKLSAYKDLIIPLKVESFLRYKPKWSQEDFPTTIDIFGSCCEVEYTFDCREPFDGYTLLVPKDLFFNYSAASWVALIPGVRRKLIDFLLESLPKKIRSSFNDKEELLEYLTQSYELVEPFDQWLVSQLAVFADSALTYGDLAFSKVPEFLLPFVVLEDSYGHIEEIGRVRFDNTLDIANQRSQQIQVSDDIFLQIYRSAQSGVFYLPKLDDNTLIFFGNDPYLWTIYLRENILTAIYNKLPLQRRKMLFDVARELQDFKGLLLQVLGREIPLNPFEKLSLEDIDFYAEMIVEDHWARLCSDLSDMNGKAKRLLKFTKSSSGSWVSKNLTLAEQSLKDQSFLAGLPHVFYNRFPLWIDLLEDMRTKQYEKKALLESFEAEFLSLLKTLGVEPSFPKNSLLLAIYLEWAIALFRQPVKPMRPLSLKKALSWATQSQNFLVF